MLSMHRTMLPQRYISDMMPSIPAGNCKHPTTLVAIAAPDGFQAALPFIAVSDVDAALHDAVAAGCTVERATWTIPNVGKLARFKDPSGTQMGLIAL